MLQKTWDEYKKYAQGQRRESSPIYSVDLILIP